jgi:hypothetical protein
MLKYPRPELNSEAINFRAPSELFKTVDFDSDSWRGRLIDKGFEGLY